MSRPREYDEDTISTALRLPKSLHELLTQTARDRGLTMNRLVIFALNDYIPRLLPIDEIKLTKDGG